MTTATYDTPAEDTGEKMRGGQPSIPATEPEEKPQRLPLGPLQTIHVFWMAGMSCDGCTITVAGATNPGIEGLLLGTVPAMPKVLLHHPVLSVEAGAEFMASFKKAHDGTLGDPYVVVFEGSVPDERIAARTGGYWSAMGSELMSGEAEGGVHRMVPTTEWLSRLAPGSAATIAIGTCATWGGVPSAEGNPTNAMSVMDFLGKDFRSAFGLPVINIPGCAPQGDNFTETVFAILLFLQGLGPLPSFDELGRPAWLYGETVHRGCTRAGYYEEGVFAEEYGDPECLVEIGCWGPVVNCNIVKRGAINHMGGCMEAGGVCIACTMPGFPDKFSPFYKAPPGGIISTTAARSVGGVMRRLRRLSNRHASREHRWDVDDAIPSGWANMPGATLGLKFVELFYQKWQHWGARKPGRRPGEEAWLWGGTRPGKPSDYKDGSVSEGKMTDAELWRAWQLWMLLATVIILVAAVLLILIWRTARGIHAEAVRAIAAAARIRDSTAPIWALETTNDVAASMLETVQHIEANGGALAAALESHAGAR